MLPALSEAIYRNQFVCLSNSHFSGSQASLSKLPRATYEFFEHCSEIYNVCVN